MPKKSISTSNRQLVAFVAMTFDDRLKHIYDKVVKPVLEHHGFKCMRGDEIRKIGIIIDQIRDVIKAADLIICDLTFENPNVFYELGIAHSFDKDTVLISQSAASIPFDTRHWRVIPYQDNKIGLLDFKEELEAFLNEYYPSDGQMIKSEPKKGFPMTMDEVIAQRSNLFSNSVDFKNYAIKFLGDNKDKDSFGRIKMLATHSDSTIDMRRDAFTALYKIDPEEAFNFLLDRGLRQQEEYLVRERVVDLLGNYPPDRNLFPGQALFDQMVAQLQDTSWGVRRAVCQVLGRWGKKEAIGYIQEKLTDNEPLVRSAGMEALERINKANPK